MVQAVLTRTGKAAGRTEALSAVDFIAKWGPGGKSYHLGERQGAQTHFIDLCRLLGVDAPEDPDSYCFERGFRGLVKGRGFADVWKRGHFAWEYKAPNGDLNAALQQLIQYALPLENPPLLVVSDRLRIEIFTHFTGHPSERTVLELDDLRDPKATDLLRALFDDPYRFKPGRTVQQLTEGAAKTFAVIADHLRAQGFPARKAAHFLTQCVFCFFADDAGLLPADVFKRLVQKKVSPKNLQRLLTELFEKMQAGGSFGVDDIPWFNGGLFKDIEVPVLDERDVQILSEAAAENWSSIDPAIFGTLFERGLDPAKRAQLGAHYTDPATISRLLDPLMRGPLLAEWEATKEQVSGLLSKRDYMRIQAKGVPSKTAKLRDRYARLRSRANEAEREAQALFASFLDRISSYRVLDPACGSGNFLYMALKCLKDVEHLANMQAEELGLERQLSVTGPHNLLGIEKNDFAAELAKVTVWIGELQWLREHGYGVQDTPILQPLDHIETRDALLDLAAGEAKWPAATVIVGNPPFLGTKKQWKELGIEYSTSLRRAYKGRVPGFADLVCYWFAKAHESLLSGRAAAAGLVATSTIRGGLSRTVLDRIAQSCEIFNAWDELPWVNEGAAVEVSLVTFGRKEHGQPVRLNGQAVTHINADLTSGSNVATARRLSENVDCCFVGTVKAGQFDCDGGSARDWLKSPNPSGHSNAKVLRRWANGLDIVRRPSDNWVVDFGCDMPEDEAQLFELPYKHVKSNVLPTRRTSNRENYRKYWWLFAEPVPRMRAAVASLKRQLVTVSVAKHRVFAWLDQRVLADHVLSVVAREDDCTFGILQSRFHTLWSLRLGTSLEDRPRYTPSTCFETFPFPEGLAPVNSRSQETESVDGSLIPRGLSGEQRKAALRIAHTAKRLNDLREGWLNPPEWVTTEPEFTPSGLKSSPYPPRNVPRHALSTAEMEQLRKRTLTNLYNRADAWLVSAHLALDMAVASAYKFDYSLKTTDEDIYRFLLALNHGRSATPQLQIQMELLAGAPKKIAARRGKKPIIPVESDGNAAQSARLAVGQSPLAFGVPSE